MAKKKSGLDGLRIDKNTMLAVHVKEQLNQLFYNPPKYKEELEMLAYQYAQEEEERAGLHASSVTKSGNFCFKEHLINVLYKNYKDKGKKVPKLIYDLFQIQLRRNNNNPLHLQRIFEQGHNIGAKWQRLFIRGGIGVKEDMDISRWIPKYDLSYTPDAIITLDGKRYVVEIKSQNKNQYDTNKSHPTGIKQLKLYMFFEKIKYGFVLVDNKDNQDFKVLMISNITEEDPDIQKYLEKMEELQKFKKKALKKKKIPPCPCKKCTGG